MKNTYLFSYLPIINPVIQPLLCHLWGNANAKVIWEFGNLQRDAGVLFLSWHQAGAADRIAPFILRGFCCIEADLRYDIGAVFIILFQGFGG